VASLIALAALNTLSRTGLRTILGVVALPFTILACIRVGTLLGAVAGTVTDFLAVDTLGLRLGILTLRQFLLAVLLMG